MSSETNSPPPSKNEAPARLDDAALDLAVGGAQKISSSVGKGGDAKPADRS